MNEEKVINILLEHGKEISDIKEDMVTKEDFSKVMSTLDHLVGLGEKNEQEVTLINHGLRVIEERVTKLEQDAKPVSLT